MSEYGHLMHHGVKGMKWGVRNYQNADGTLTAEGRAHYGLGSMKLKRTGKNTYSHDTQTITLATNKDGYLQPTHARIKYSMDKKLAADYYNKHRSEVRERMYKQYKEDRKLAKTSSERKELKSNYKSGKKYVDSYMEKTYGKSLAKAAKNERAATAAFTAISGAVLTGLAAAYVAPKIAYVADAVKDMRR